MKEYIIPVQEKYEEKVNIFDGDGATTAVVRVSVIHVSVFASDEKEAQQLAGSTMNEWKRNKLLLKK